MIKELGSEFSLVDENCVDYKANYTIKTNGIFCFSGRTAIEIVLNDLGDKIHKIMLPSYCCDSMIAPIRCKKIEICFYKVEYDEKLKFNLDGLDDCDAILWCDYFGYRMNFPVDKIKRFRENGGIVIRDITHSLLSESLRLEDFDYFVASLRKWGPLIAGGFCAKVDSCFEKKVMLDTPSQEYVASKLIAMQLKSKYLIDGDENKKQNYLGLFRKSNDWLADNYSMMAIDDKSLNMFLGWDFERFKSQRQKNARVLHQGLSKIKGITLLFSEEYLDCPIFVPIVLKDKDTRDKLRAELTRRKIYCPVHWPRPKADCYSNLYDIEISVICDQRYLEKDMQYIVDTIEEVMNVL